MVFVRLFSTFVILISIAGAQDWANLDRYRADNERIILSNSSEKSIVFMGNSITDSWSDYQPEFFEDQPYINRGISGQTTAQMLLRFRSDVIDLKPAVVVILAGTNDIAGNTGPMTQKMILGNIISMCELAQSNHIKVVLASVLPAYEYPWKPDVKPALKIQALNRAIKAYALSSGLTYLDYFTPLADSLYGMKNEFTKDGVHPNLAGYKLMADLVRESIAEALNQP